MYRYEDLVRNPEESTRRICGELLGIPWAPGMAQPYSTPATDTFKAARKFATTDPKLLRRATIEAALADKWREIELPKSLQPSTNLLAQLFGYELLPELATELVWLCRIPAHAQPIIMVHDFTGMLWGFNKLARALRAPCLGIQCSKRLLDDCKSVQELAWRYVRMLPPIVHKPVRLVAYSFGCRIAYRMALALEQIGERVQLVLLDGPVGPDHKRSPPRMGGMASRILELLRSRTNPKSAFGARDFMTIGQDDKEVDTLVRMVNMMGEEDAEVAMSLIELPDQERPHTPTSCVSALFVSAKSSQNFTNGTVESAQHHLPGLELAAVPGGHFDFIDQSVEQIAKCINHFFSAGKP